MTITDAPTGQRTNTFKLRVRCDLGEISLAAFNDVNSAISEFIDFSQDVARSFGVLDDLPYRSSVVRWHMTHEGQRVTLSRDEVIRDRVLFARFTNPIELWLQLFGGAGVISATVLVGAFLRDFGANRRWAAARASLEEEQVAQEMAKTRVMEVNAETIASLHEFLSKQLSEQRSGDEAALIGATIDEVLTVARLEALARLSSVVVEIQDVSGEPTPQIKA